MNNKHSSNPWLKLLLRLGEPAYGGRDWEPLPRPTPILDHESIAADYPDAWRDIQKRRRFLQQQLPLLLLAALPILLILRLGPLGVPALYVSLKPLAPVILLVSLGVLWAATRHPRRFRCPRCGHDFLPPSAGAISFSLANPGTACQNCGLPISTPRG